MHRDHIKTNRDKSSQAYYEFTELRKAVKNMQKRKFIQYIENIGEEIKINSKRFWTYVKYLKGVSSLPQIMIYRKCELKSYADIANVFNDFFQVRF